ncbi:DUF5134 domain-containing protein [Streptomyces sp. NPDC048717]|uniref:DUF5134 domain-containing protein n=1 Tax=Streptomyces sp. NPDC048717 TaxID=3154928 RepID=UPI0034496366
MHGPAAPGWLLVALCGASGAYCLVLMVRTARGRSGGPPGERGGAGSEALMGFGMAAMALPAAVLTPPSWSWAVYAVIFGLAALYGLAAAAGRGRARRAHHLHHLVGSSAMVYMAVAMAAAPGAHGGHGGGHGHPAAGGVPVLTGVLLVYFGGYALRAGARLVPGAAPAGAAMDVGVGVGAAGGSSGAGVAELTRVCRLSMALAMLAMLVTL